MSKFDRNFLRLLSSNTYISNNTKCNSNNAKIMSKDDVVDALVRVHNPLHFSVLEHNFDITRLYPFIRTVGIKCGLKEAIELERMQEVEHVCAQSRVCALEDNDIKNSQSECVNIKDTQPFNNDFITALSCKYDGSGVGICVMDTGVAPHLDLSIPRERIVHFEDFIQGEVEPYDDNGHGTFVAGIACGSGVTSGGKIKGVASCSDIIGVKVISKSGESGTFNILDGMQWLFDNFKRYNIRVACMSFGAEPLEFADPLKIGVEMLSRSGIICVVASGNSGIGALKSPAISNEVIAVGAVDQLNNVATFTSRGKYNGVVRPDVYADGVDVKSIRVGGTYGEMSGTSASAPYVAGACCLLCEQYKNITPMEAKTIIINNSCLHNGIRIFR